MVNELSCGCHPNVVCYACFQAAKRGRGPVPEGDFPMLRWLASPFTIRRKLTPRQIDHRRRMHAHLAAHA
jgi:hypothetical protein